MNKLLFFSILLLTCVTGWANGIRNFYVDSFSDSQVADGSMESPFKSLDALKGVKFLPGDCIHLAGNQILTGTIHVKGVKATSENPLTITSYGTGVSHIYSVHSSAIVIDACENIHVKNVVVKGSGRKKGNTGTGIEVVNSRLIEVDRVEASGYQMNGIGVTGGGDVRITHSYVHDNGYNGIEVTGKWGTKSVHNIYIGHCVAENNAGNPAILDNHSGSGILVGHATNVTIEYCEAMGNGWDMPRSGNGPVGIWGYESDRLTIQYCFSHDNKTSPEGLDGGGFDFDGGITNSLMQYNLAMNNEGAGYGLFQFGGATEWNNNIVRYNVSINDGIKNSHAGICVWCDPYNKDVPLCETKVHDNLIISNQGYSISFNTGFSSGLEFANNTFILTNGGIEHLHGDETKGMAIYKGNRFWSETAGQKGERQPRVPQDATANYEAVGYNLPVSVDIFRLKEIITDMIPLTK